VERLTERLAEATRALAQLDELAALLTPSVLERDAAILRFAYTFESAWKTAQRYLADREGVEAGSPKACVRASRTAGLLTDDEAELALAAADDRNLVVHVYREALAEAIFRRLARHADVLRVWLAAMRRGADTT
jgi:nucleotidyltransferase substrate binding protein (TIGR01987 family)